MTRKELIGYLLIGGIVFNSNNKKYYRVKNNILWRLDLDHTFWTVSLFYIIGLSKKIDLQYKVIEAVNELLNSNSISSFSKKKPEKVYSFDTLS